MKQPSRFDPQWAEAKRLCRLNMGDIQMAKELGLSPRSLMKNIPNRHEQWKLPVKQWVRELYEKRLGRKRQAQSSPPVSPATFAKPVSIPKALQASADEISDRLVPF